MASESSRGQQNQQLDNLISCAICHDYFVDPRILPCSHTYCLRCIHQMASSNRGEFECPMRDGTKVGKNHIDSLPINRAIRDMVDVLPNVINRSERNKDTAPPKCCECLSAVADLWCSNCGASHCTECSTTIHKPRTFAQHRPVPIHEKPAEMKRCDKHPDEKLKYWCSCETLICRDCERSKQHKDHTAVPIVEVVLDITEKLRAGFKEAQTSLNQKIGPGMSFTSENENPIMKSITRTFDGLRKRINDCEKALKDQIRAIEENNNKLVEKYRALLNSKQITLSNQNKDFEKIVSTNDHTQLLEAKTRLTDSLEQLTNELKELEPPIKTEYRIEGVDQLQARINDILKEARVVEQKPESLQFARPGVYNQLGCQGRHCANCGKCRDWQFTGDLATWQWIQGVKSWTNDHVQRWQNGKIWERFKKRDGATCTYDYRVYRVHHDRVGVGLCVCDDNYR